MNMTIGRRVMTGLAVVTLVGCGGGSSVEFNETDAEGLAMVIDSAVTEESGMKGLVTADAFGPADVAEFNGIAEQACDELAKDFGPDQIQEFTDGVLEGAAEMEGLLDIEGLLTALVGETCPGNSAALASALDASYDPNPKLHQVSDT